MQHLCLPARLDRAWREWKGDGCFARAAVADRAENTMKVWNTLKTTYKVSDFIGWYRDGALDLSPNFQRRSVWKVGAKSYLIDTIIRGLPIPIIFLRDRKSDPKKFSPRREVVDGQQRLRTVISFVAPKMLKDFDPDRDDFKINKNHNADLANHTFETLSDENKNQILDYQFSVNVFPSDTDDREVKQVFARMNSSGYRLNSQELRHAEFFGAFKTLAENLSNEQLGRWRDKWKVFSIDALARMEEVELVSEFMIMALHGVTEKTDKVISAVYREHDDAFAAGKEIAKRLRTVFEQMDEFFSDDTALVFRKRSMLYGLFAAIYDLQYGLQSATKPTRAATLQRDTIEAIKESARRVGTKRAPQSVMDATTRRTSHIKERKQILNYLLRGA